MSIWTGLNEYLWGRVTDWPCRPAGDRACDRLTVQPARWQHTTPIQIVYAASRHSIAHWHLLLIAWSCCCCCYRRSSSSRSSSNNTSSSISSSRTYSHWASNNSSTSILFCVLFLQELQSLQEYQQVQQHSGSKLAARHKPDDYRQLLLLVCPQYWWWCCWCCFCSPCSWMHVDDIVPAIAHSIIAQHIMHHVFGQQTWHVDTMTSVIDGGLVCRVITWHCRQWVSVSCSNMTRWHHDQCGRRWVIVSCYNMTR